MIFYCEVIRCNKIILTINSRRWLITNPILIEKLNITIIQHSNPNVDCNDDIILCIFEYKFNVYYPYIVKPEIRINYIKDDILSNLPKVAVEPNDLYIHIRGHDIFQVSPQNHYIQPPLCYYEKLIDYNKFNKIYIISKDKTNVVIELLINKYKHIKFDYHHYEYDISLLAHDYNKGIPFSTLSMSSIIFK